MKIIKKLSAFILLLAMLISVVCVAPFDVFAATIYNVSTAQELTDACADINTKGGEHIISLTDNISGGVSIDISKSDAVVTVIGNGHTVSSTGQAVCVLNGATVNLGDGNSELTLKSVNEISDPGIIYVLDDGICNMYDKVTVKDHKGNNYFGGGVTVQGGIFHMYGGTIDNCGIDGGSVCYGGGVGVAFGGQFIMDGGVIKNCYVRSDLGSSLNASTTYVAGGGVFVYRNGSFVMNGGEIKDCTAEAVGDYPSVGGGVAVITSKYSVEDNGDAYGYLDAAVVINGGTISGCTADFGGGIGAGKWKAYLSPQLTPHPSTTPNPNAPGVSSTGGTITNNTANVLGGGLYLNLIRQATSFSGLTLTDNEAPAGGAVCVDSFYTNATFTDCTMTGNSATNGKGGAIFINENYREDAKTNINGGTITDNTATDKGGGIYYSSESQLNIKGDLTVQDNTVNNKANNLYFLGTDYPVYVNGSLSGSRIGITDAKLWEDNKEDTAENAESSERLTDGFKANNESLIPADAFTSDHKSWYVDFGEKKTEQGAEIGRTYSYKATEYLKDENLTTGYPVLQCNRDSYIANYIQFDATTFNNYTTNGNTVYSELQNRFENEYKSLGNGPYADYGWDHSLYFDSRTNLYISLLSNKRYSVYVFSGTDLNDVSRTNYDRGYFLTAGDVQAYNGQDAGKVKMELKDNYYDDGTPTGNTPSRTNVDLVLKQPLDFGNSSSIEIPLVNDLGIVTGKYVVEKSSEKCDIQYDTITTDYTSEVRLVRRTTPIKFHDNKDKVKKGEDKLFRVYNATDTSETVENGYHDLVNYKVPEFYDIPSFAEDDYVFAGWYTTYDNSDNSSDKAFKFNSEIPASVTDVYAHWIPVGEVDQQKDLSDPENKETNDFKILPAGMNGKYKGFELFGVQIRPEYNFDHNYGYGKPGGLRFITSIREDLLSKVDALSDKTTNGNKVEYGFVTASESTVTKAMEKLGITNTTSYKLQYKGVNVNGVDTVMDNKTNKEDRKNANNFRYVTNVDCTSQVGGYGSNPKIKIDHHNYTGYRLATFVVTYDNNTDKDEKVAARAYMRYYDANGLLRTFYNDYGGTSFYGCCSTTYNSLYNAFKADRNTVS